MTKAVTLPRADYEALLQRLEDTEDRAVLAAAIAREEALGRDAARAGALPIERVSELIAGDHPIRVWRRHRGLSRQALAAMADISASHLTAIERGRKPGSAPTILRLIAALDAPPDAVAAWLPR